jgi:urea transport system permease protein
MTAVTTEIPARSAWLRPWPSIVILILVLLALYPLAADVYSVSVLRDTLIFGLFALSLDFLWGKAGILSFGHAAFFGLGAYGTAIIAQFLSGNAYASVIGAAGGIALAAGVALCVGYFLIFGGVRGAYLTIVTLAVSLVAQQIAVGWASVTGGDAGLIGTPPPGFAVPGLSYGFVDPVAQYWLVLGIAALALTALWRASRGQFGRVLAAIRDNELRARTLGYDTSLRLLAVLVVSSGLAAVAGALYASLSGFVAPDLTGLFLSTEVIVWVAVGGRGTLIGPFVGAFVVIRLQEVVSSYSTKLWPLLIGLFFIAMVFLFPDGLLSLVGRLRGVLVRAKGMRTSCFAASALRLAPANSAASSDRMARARVRFSTCWPERCGQRMAPSASKATISSDDPSITSPGSVSCASFRCRACSRV